MEAAAVNGATLHYRLIGMGEGRPVVAFANSLGTDFRIWDAVAEKLCDEFTLLLYDKRGHGLSSLPDGSLTMDDHVDDLIGLLDHLQLRDVTLCGLSVGGQIAQGVYGRRPDLVRGLILMDTAHKIGTEAIWNERIETARSDGIAAMADAILGRWFTAGFREGSAAFPLYRAMLERTTVAGYAGTCEALRDSDFTAVCQTIDVPTLLLVGDEDGSTPPELVRSASELIEGSQFEIIRNAGHLPNVEQADIVAGKIATFMREKVAPR